MTTESLEAPDPELARQILLDAGADPETIVVKEYAFGWNVAAEGFGSGCSSSKKKAMDTPQEVSAHLVALRRDAGPAATNPTQPAAGPVEEEDSFRPDEDTTYEDRDLGEEVLEWEDETGQDGNEGVLHEEEAAPQVATEDLTPPDRLTDRAEALVSTYPGLILGADDKRRNDLSLEIDASARYRIEAQQHVITMTDLAYLNHKLMRGDATGAERSQERAYWVAVSLQKKIADFAESLKVSLMFKTGPELDDFDLSTVEWPKPDG